MFGDNEGMMKSLGNEWLQWTSDKLNKNDEFVNSIVQSNPIKNYEKGEVIYWQGKPGDKFYLLLEGRVEVNFVNNEGKKRIVSIHEPKCFIGESILDGFPHILTAVSLTPVKVAVLSIKDVNSWDREMLLELNKSLAWKSRIVIGQLTDQTFNEVGNRVEDLLLGLCNKFGKIDSDGIRVELPITHQLIADLVGSSRVRVSQSLGHMVKTKQLTMGRKNFRVCDTKRAQND